MLRLVSALASSRTQSFALRCRPPTSKVSACFWFHSSGLHRKTAGAGEIPIIRVPKSMQKRVESVKEIVGKTNIHNVRAGRLLIQSKDPSLSQSAAHMYAKFEKPVLCSKGWKHNKSYGDYFAINRTRSVAPCVADSQKVGEEKETLFKFNHLRICKPLADVLEGMNITRPTTVQLQTVPKVMKGHNVLCAAETGSGKTLSYLLPIIHKLQAQTAPETDVEERKIHALVLVPSRELSEQVAAVSRMLCRPFGIVTKTVGGGRGVGHIKMLFKRHVPDILVATPGALVKALQRRCLDLSELSFFVIDEADTMFDPSFSGMLENILKSAIISRDPSETNGPGHKAQLLVIGATFPGGVKEVLSQVTDLGKMKIIKSKMLHFLMPHVKQTFLKVKSAEKILELHQALKVHEKDNAAVLVFCNKSTTVNWLGYSLDEIGVRHARLQGEMAAAVRSGIFHQFQKEIINVLICTDIASRGLDTSRVQLVVNYDFPLNPADYIHRAGRVGRAGGQEDAEVLNFVTHPWDVELVQKIEAAARKRTYLPGMEKDDLEPKSNV
ncbi:probable ATP-dependent RNA helicase DDX28 [Eucyclogobius newberryi]|uniref:probable ATP-dependent RNA helicase DDX28 n=1 Tax=Eucyclogobius newberryi TaxID=166745 RepID=UPI003B5AD167